MPEHTNHSRRNFFRKLGSSAVSVAAISAAIASGIPQSFYILKPGSPVAASNRINLACIGMGIVGFGDVKTALTQPGVALIAAADLYKGHLTKVKEVYGGQVKTTMNFREVLEYPFKNPAGYAKQTRFYITSF